jgi:3-oxoacyl-[acyl-carrier protein] reductase
MIAVVTGGSRGIGAAIVRRLAKDGYDVALIYRSGETEASALARECSSAGVRVVPFQADLGNREEAAGVAIVSGRNGSGHSTCQQRGHHAGRAGRSYGRRKFYEVLDTNLTSAFVLCRAFLPDMMKARGGGS